MISAGDREDNQVFDFSVLWNIELNIQTYLAVHFDFERPFTSYFYSDRWARFDKRNCSLLTRRPSSDPVESGRSREFTEDRPLWLTRSSACIPFDRPLSPGSSALTHRSSTLAQKIVCFRPYSTLDLRRSYDACPKVPWTLLFGLIFWPLIENKVVILKISITSSWNEKFNVNTIISQVRLSVGLMSRYFEVLNMDQCVCHRTIDVNTEDVFFVISFFRWMHRWEHPNWKMAISRLTVTLRKSWPLTIRAVTGLL